MKELKKRIYSEKKYLDKNASSSNKGDVWYYKYKYEGQKSFWARTELSPDEYEKLRFESAIELESSKLKIKFKDEEYDMTSLRKLYNSLSEEEIKINEEDETNKSLKKKSKFMEV